ncbi:MAG: aminotransferase class V-fold PLP-dependent enzyme [Clostridia bacterium]|nr:aminotransferase class V-fold PLP-dependent enzyme [Clostridia bacterium]
MDKNRISWMLDGVDKYPFHMPGHKRNVGLVGRDFPYDRDITEISGSDNLHDMSGVIKEECDRAAALWGAKRAHILVNGSTSGILAAIRAYAGHDCSVVVARNCHKSVYHGIELCRLKPTYIYPKTDPASGICASISPAEVDRALADAPDARLVVLTSPTYEGVISDIAGIARVVHARGALLLVDAAHGAHLGLGGFAAHPVTLGADVVICSLHKTLPAPTQTAVALIGKSCPNPAAMAAQLAVFQTSSPSYVLMEESARCIHLLQREGEKLMRAWLQRLTAFEADSASLQHLQLLFRGDLPDGVFAYDPGKLVISTRGANLSGHELADVLRHEYKIEIEMAASDYIIAMTSPADTDEGFALLARALCEIDVRIEADSSAYPVHLPQLHTVYAPWQVADLPQICLPASEADGFVSAEYVWAYPPGIPLVVPGEMITDQMLAAFAAMQSRGTELHSTNGQKPEQMPDALRVVTEESI